MPVLANERRHARRRSAPKAGRRGRVRTHAIKTSSGYLGSYIDRGGKRREVVAYRGPGQSTLVIDHEQGTRADCRLVAHLAADEPFANARTVASVYLADARRSRCRRVTREDLEVAPATELHAGCIIDGEAVPAGGVEVLVVGVPGVVGVAASAEGRQEGLDAGGEVRFVFGFPFGLVEQCLQFAGDVVEACHQVLLVGARGGDPQPAVEVLS